MFDVITIGDAVYDTFIKPCDDHFCHNQIGLEGDKLYLRHGDKITVEEVYFDIGGSACNVAVGLARLGLKTALIGAVGQDFLAEKIIERLGDEGVAKVFLKREKNIATSLSTIIVYKGERTVLVYRGIKDYSQLKIPKSLKTSWIYLGPLGKEFSRYYSTLISLASEKNINIVINPGNRQIENPHSDLLRFLRICKILILNKQEAIDLTKLASYSDIKKILLTLKSYGPQIVIVTDGAKGAYLMDDEGAFGIKSFPVQCLEPTGAGDAFSCGFIGGLMQTESVMQAMQWGIVNSAMVVEKFGAQSNLQNQRQLERLVKQAPAIYKLE